MKLPESDELKDEGSKRLSRALVEHLVNISGSSQIKESRFDKWMGRLGMAVALTFVAIMLVLAIGILIWVVLATYLLVAELVKLVF